jgi:beta-N-acetylhexosaminidase
VSPQPLRREIGQLVIGSFRGAEIPVELRSLAREFDLGGVTLFGRLGNIQSPEQVAELSFDARTLGRELPGWVGIDQEGGRVARLRSPFTEWPPMAVLGRSEDERLAARFGKALAAELSAVGISLDYAPVLDIRTNPKNTVIGDRALGERPDVVARLGRIIIDELQNAGVAACGKHFPGHGDTSADSHFELPIIEQPPERLRAVEFVPFKAAIAANVAFIMTAHVRVITIDDAQPATLSRKVVHEILREELGFRGVIASDDLEMRAISAQCSVADAAVRAISAGCDVLLMGGEGADARIDHEADAIEALIRAVENGQLPLTRVQDALSRNRAAKERFLRDWRPLAPRQLRSVIGCDAHRAVAEEMSAFV